MNRKTQKFIELYADTHYLPFHIYRESELRKLQEYKENLAYIQPSVADTSLVHDNAEVHSTQTVTPGKITLAMLVRNESGRHLEKILKQATEYIDQAVILDDASENNTAWRNITDINNSIPTELIVI